MKKKRGREGKKEGGRPGRKKGRRDEGEERREGEKVKGIHSGDKFSLTG